VRYNRVYDQGANKQGRRMKKTNPKKPAYDKDVVRSVLTQLGVDAPVFEHKFHPVRRWRFDLAWPEHKLALEVQGGIFTNGRHTRGAALLKEWEKLNTAAEMGWRIVFCQPSDLMKTETIEMLKRCMLKQTETEEKANERLQHEGTSTFRRPAESAT